MFFSNRTIFFILGEYDNGVKRTVFSLQRRFFDAIMREHRRMRRTRSRQFASYFWTDLTRSRWHAKNVRTFNCENGEPYPNNSVTASEIIAREKIA